MQPRKATAITRIKTNRSYKELAGDFGEEKVYQILNIYVKRKIMVSKIITRFAYKTFKSSREVDMIFIYRKGVFVLEIKYWPGIIRGSSRDIEWQITNRGQTKRYKSPFVQLTKYIPDIQEMLGNKYPVYPLVVFTSDNVTAMNISNVINANNIPFYFDRFSSSKLLTDQEINEAYRILEARKANDNVSIGEHKKNAISSRKFEENKKSYKDVPAIIRNTRRKY